MADSSSEPAQAHNMSTANQQPLKLSTHLNYGVGGFAPSALGVFSRSFLLFFYVQHMGLEPWLAGLALTLGRLWDAVSDPLMGAISDRTKSRWGRRRPYIVFGSIPLALTYVALWLPPTSLDQAGLFAYLLIIDIAFNTMITLVFVPYSSLGAELSTDYHERTKVAAIRMLFAQLGWFLGATGVRINQAMIDTGEGVGGTLGAILSYHDGYAMCAVVFGLLTIGTLVWSGLKTPEIVSDAKATVGYIASYVRTLKNRSFVVIVIAFLLAAIFETIGFSIFPFLVGFWYYQGDMEAMNLNLMWIMLPLMLITIPAVWFWTEVSKRIGKKTTLLIGCVLSSITIAMHYPMVTPHAPYLIYIITIIFGWAIAAPNLIISAVIPDIVDEEELITGGVRREGSFFGMQSFVSKLGAALGLLLVGIFLSMIGFVEGATQQSDYTIEWLRRFFAWFRGGGYLVAFGIVLLYPLTEKRVREIRYELTRRQSTRE